MSPLKRLIWTILTLGSIGVLLALGTWQVQRLRWKEEKIAAYEKAATMEAVDVASLIPLVGEMQYRRASITGEWIADKELHLGGRRWHTETGYHILSPLRTKEGKIYLINRGWVPTKLKDPATRNDNPLPEGEVTVTGMIRLPEPPGLFTPANHPEKNFWFSVDIAAMGKTLSLEPEPLVLEIINPKASGTHYPIPQDGKVVLRNDHLGYAITWYSLAIAAAIIGILVLRSPTKGKSES